MFWVARDFPQSLQGNTGNVGSSPYAVQIHSLLTIAPFDRIQTETPTTPLNKPEHQTLTVAYCVYSRVESVLVTKCQMYINRSKVSQGRRTQSVTFCVYALSLWFTVHR